MSLESNSAESLRKSQDAQLRKDFEAARCTIITEKHGDKWRVIGMGARRAADGNVQLVTVTREFDTFSDMVNDLSKLSSSFYEITPEKIVPNPNIIPINRLNKN